MHGVSMHIRVDIHSLCTVDASQKTDIFLPNTFGDFINSGPVAMYDLTCADLMCSCLRYREAKKMEMPEDRGHATVTHKARGQNLPPIKDRRGVGLSTNHNSTTHQVGPPLPSFFHGKIRPRPATWVLKA